MKIKTDAITYSEFVEEISQNNFKFRGYSVRQDEEDDDVFWICRDGVDYNVSPGDIIVMFYDGYFFPVTTAGVEIIV